MHLSLFARPALVRFLKWIDDKFWGVARNSRVHWLGYDSGIKPGEHACTVAGCTASHEKARRASVVGRRGLLRSLKENTNRFVKRDTVAALRLVRSKFPGSAKTPTRTIPTGIFSSTRPRSTRQYGHRDDPQCARRQCFSDENRTPHARDYLEPRQGNGRVFRRRIDRHRQTESTRSRQWRSPILSR